MKKNYTIIIPHKDSQNTLYRCINSIPRRDDIEIIVVDDNSSCKEFDVDFLRFHNVQLIMSETSLTAGGARNLGLKKACGKWILFADADDYYLPNFLNSLDLIVNEDYDIVIFDVDDSQNQKMNFDKLHRSVQNQKDDDLVFLRYGLRVVWCKMFNSDFIKKYSVDFEQIRTGNDIMFSFATSYFAQSINIIHEKLYVYTYNSHGITFSKKSIKDGFEEFKLCNRYNAFLDYVKHTEFKRSYFRFFASSIKRNGIMFTFNLFIMILFNIFEVISDRNSYVNYVKLREF